MRLVRGSSGTGCGDETDRDRGVGSDGNYGPGTRDPAAPEQAAGHGGAGEGNPAICGAGDRGRAAAAHERGGGDAIGKDAGVRGGVAEEVPASGSLVG